MTGRSARTAIFRVRSYEQLPGLIERKLDVGRELFPDQYADFPDLKSIFRPLYYPDRHRPPLGDSDDGAKRIQFAGAGLNKQQAIALIRERALPAIFGPPPVTEINAPG